MKHELGTQKAVKYVYTASVTRGLARYLFDKSWGAVRLCDAGPVAARRGRSGGRRRLLA